MKKNIIFSLAIFIFFLFLVFRNWFIYPQIIGGDWPYFYSENIRAFGFLPPAWNSAQGDGMGGQSLSYALDSYLYFTGWLFSAVLHIPWEIVYKIFWFGMFIFLSTFSMYKLQNKLFPAMGFVYKLLGSFIYTTNTYILMVVGGGQMGVSLGYAIAPLVLLLFINLIAHVLDSGKGLKNSKLSSSLIAGLFFAIQLMFDIRMTYVTVIVIAFFIVFEMFFRKQKINKTVLISLILYVFIIPAIITVLLHTFWLLPFLYTGKASISQLGGGYTSANSVAFFSFAVFENAFGLLHPNWPENIFGKVGFMRAEFLMLPMLAYASLMFVKNVGKNTKLKLSQKNNIEVILSQNKVILCMCLLGIIGAFLAKGANDPFGVVYLWFFAHVPGFVMFRDPTKFYLLIALVHAVLIPFSLWKIIHHFSKVKFFSFIGFIAICAFWFVLIKPAFLGELGGTFATHTVPTDYVQLKDNLLNNPEFSRTLWIPKMQRYGFVSQMHPAVEASTVLGATNSAQIIAMLKEKNTETKLANLSIQYIIVPIDSESEIFLKDRKYDDTERKIFINQLQTISWLRRDKTYKDLAVYSLTNHKDKFWLQGGGNIQYEKKSDTLYALHIQSNAATKLIMTESYSPYWVASLNSEVLESKSFNNLVSFDLPKDKKDTDVTIYYSLERFYVLGRIVSLIAFTILILVLIMLKRDRIKKLFV